MRSRRSVFVLMDGHDWPVDGVLERRRPSDWLGTLFDTSDVVRFLHLWVIPRLGADVWLEDVDTAGPPDHWMSVLSARDADELADMIGACKSVCARFGVNFEHLLEEVRHRAWRREGPGSDV